jgi:hypothetical protein
MIKETQQFEYDYPQLYFLTLATAALAYRPFHTLKKCSLAGLREEIPELEDWRESSTCARHQSVRYLTVNVSAIIFPAGSTWYVFTVPRSPFKDPAMKYTQPPRFWEHDKRYTWPKSICRLWDTAYNYIVYQVITSICQIPRGRTVKRDRLHSVRWVKTPALGRKVIIHKECYVLKRAGFLVYKHLRATAIHYNRCCSFLARWQGPCISFVR